MEREKKLLNTSNSKINSKKKLEKISNNISIGKNNIYDHQMLHVEPIISAMSLLARLWNSSKKDEPKNVLPSTLYVNIRQRKNKKEKKQTKMVKTAKMWQITMIHGTLFQFYQESSRQFVEPHSCILFIF